MQSNAWGDALFMHVWRYIQSPLGDIYNHRPKVVQPLTDDCYYHVPLIATTMNT